MNSYSAALSVQLSTVDLFVFYMVSFNQGLSLIRVSVFSFGILVCTPIEVGTARLSARIEVCEQKQAESWGVPMTTPAMVAAVFGCGPAEAIE